MAARCSRVPAPVGATSPSVGPWGSARSNNSSGSYLTNWTMSLFGLGSLGSRCIEYKSNTQKNLHLSFLLLQCLRKHLITQAQDHTWLRGHPVQKLNASAELARTQQPFLHIICTEQPPDSLSRGHFGELSQRHTAGTKKQLSLFMNGKKEPCTNSLSCPEYLVIPRQPRTPSALGLCRDRCPYHTSGPWQHTEHSKRSNRQRLILKPSPQQHSWSDPPHPCRQNCRTVSNSPHISAHHIVLFCMRRGAPLYPLQMPLWRQN